MPATPKQSVVSQLFKDAMHEPSERGQVLVDELIELQHKGRYSSGTGLSIGGMKEILLSCDQMIHRKVAMAVPRKDKQDYESIWGFIREARITAKVAHPNIVPVHEIGVNEEGVPFYTMKYIQGEDLGSILAKLKSGDEQALKDYPLHKLLSIFMKVCEAIAFAHSQGVIHLDLKPENILVSTFGQVQVCDWGLAHELKNIEETLEPEIKGTPGFLSPEQITGEGIGVCSDVYSLGAVLYNLLSYRRPCWGNSLEELLKATVTGQIGSIDSLGLARKISGVLQAIVSKAMHVDLEKRYQNVSELLADLEAYQNHYPTRAQDPGFLSRFLLFTKRYKTSSMLVLLALVVITVISSLFRLKVQEEVYKRKEIAEKAVGHYNKLAEENILNFKFDEAVTNISQALKSKGNQESHWLKTKVHMARRELKKARVHALQCNDGLVAVIDQLDHYKNKESDEFLLILIDELSKQQLHDVVRDIMWVRNLKYNSLEEHLPFIKKALRILNNQMTQYDLSVQDGKIYFTASTGFSRFAPFMNLPVEKLVLNNSSSYELRGLRGMKHLRHLELRNTQVFEVPELRGMTLDYLDLSGSNIYSFKDLVHVKVKHLVFTGGKAIYLRDLMDNPILEKLEIDRWRYNLPHHVRTLQLLEKEGLIRELE